MGREHNDVVPVRTRVCFFESTCDKRLWGRSGWMGESGRQPGSQAEKGKDSQILRFSDSRSHGDSIFFLNIPDWASG